ncbi:MAG: sigma-70 family RNA polymerase sigma factor [Pyrinomonadaceae bacterium]|nr:sigma-70 family RNA polymerase sigma factor [Pyrinomonadaceae bacterium]
MQATAAARTRPKVLPEATQKPRELESLFQEHYEHVFRTAYRITGSASDAEDVLQTVFLRLIKSSEGIDQAESPKGYLLRAAVNASLDLMRSHTRSKSVAIDDVEYDLTDNKRLSPEAAAEDRELRNLIQEAVARLGERASEVFVLRYFEGYDNREIADMLGTSQMVVAVTLHRARSRMRKEIGEYLEKYNEA